MMAFSQILQSQVMSDLLTIREKGILAGLLEPDCKLVKTTVAQILQANDTEGQSRRWHRLDCGVVCLVENMSVQSYFLRLYCVHRAKLLWEHELYIPFRYIASHAYFHTFPGEDEQVGLNFANEAEAEEFHSAVQRAQRKMINNTKSEEKSNTSSNPPVLRAKNEEILYEETTSILPVSASPSLFSDLDPSMRTLLMEARLNEEDLKNKDVAEVVDCIINQFGGLKAVQRELKKKDFAESGRASISFALQKGPLPPVPSTQNSQETPENAAKTDMSLDAPHASGAAGRMRRSASFKDVSSVEPQGSDLIVNSLRELFRQKKMSMQNSPEYQN